MEKARSRTPAQRWFDERPEVLAEVLEGLRNGVACAQVHRWLQRHHGFAWSRETLLRVLEPHGRTGPT